MNTDVEKNIVKIYTSDDHHNTMCFGDITMLYMRTVGNTEYSRLLLYFDPDESKEKVKSLLNLIDFLNYNNKFVYIETTYSKDYYKFIGGYDLHYTELTNDDNIYYKIFDYKNCTNSNFKKPYILLNPTSSTIDKDYMYYDSVLYDLYNTYNYKGYVYCIGHNIDAGIKESLTNLNCSDKIVFENNTTYQELLNLILNAEAFLTNDSFPMWVAIATKLKYKPIVPTAKKLLYIRQSPQLFNMIFNLYACDSDCRDDLVELRRHDYYYCDRMCRHKIDYHNVLDVLLKYTRKEGLSD
jgi:hypothetical protein